MFKRSHTDQSQSFGVDVVINLMKIQTLQSLLYWQSCMLRVLCNYSEGIVNIRNEQQFSRDEENGAYYSLTNSNVFFPVNIFLYSFFIHLDQCLLSPCSPPCPPMSTAPHSPLEKRNTRSLIICYKTLNLSFPHLVQIFVHIFIGNFILS